jgi:hypothetical protein
MHPIVVPRIYSTVNLISETQGYLGIGPLGCGFIQPNGSGGTRRSDLIGKELRLTVPVGAFKLNLPGPASFYVELRRALANVRFADDGSTG